MSGNTENAGWRFEDLIEPTIDAADLERYPELEDELRVPNFIIFALKKGTSFTRCGGLV
jgi:hypothetical protein